ncbi:MAG TPA: alpha-L-fucosidase [Verrucomicrobiae bacterium]|nr:alpha-L-fucosidase [Verrucomicrobiae bacterium]
MLWVWLSLTGAIAEFVSAPESSRQREIPAWFQDAKLGILVHWGLYSVPAWAPVSGTLPEVVAREGWGGWFTNHPGAEWYANSLKLSNSPVWRRQREIYGPIARYDDFVPQFDEATRGWNPSQWIDLFTQAGARYVILTAKHHDGFLLWPGQQIEAPKTNYHAARDLVGDLASAARERKMRFGVYYSGGLDWNFNQRPITNVVDLFVGIHAATNYLPYFLNHWRDLVDRYQPSILWNDLGSPVRVNVEALLDYYYAKVPDGVANDRFRLGLLPGDNTAPGDFRTPDYSAVKGLSAGKFEVTRVLGLSSGYNQQETGKDLATVDEIVRQLVDVVAKNGNLLLNIGPAADGSIPRAQRERLLGLGQWLRDNGDAIYGTRPWRVAEAKSREGDEVRFTQKGPAVYVFLPRPPSGGTLTLPSMRAMEDTKARLLAKTGAPLKWSQTGNDLQITLPRELPVSPVLTLELSPQPIWLAK